MTDSNKNTFDLRENWKKIAAPLALTIGVMGGLTGCFETPAKKASDNLKTAAENFELQRDVVFYNAIQGHFFATVKGRCSIDIDNTNDKLDVTCKHGPEDLRNHYLGRAAGVTYFVLQTEPAQVSEYHTRVTFNPQGFIPDVDFRGSAEELVNPTRPDTHGEPVPQEAQPVEKSENPAQQPVPQAALVPILQGQKP